MLTEVWDPGPVAGISVCVCVRRSLPFSLPVYCDTLNCFAKTNKKSPMENLMDKEKVTVYLYP